MELTPILDLICYICLAVNVPDICNWGGSSGNEALAQPGLLMHVIIFEPPKFNCTHQCQAKSSWYEAVCMRFCFISNWHVASDLCRAHFLIIETYCAVHYKTATWTNTSVNFHKLVKSCNEFRRLCPQERFPMLISGKWYSKYVSGKKFREVAYSCLIQYVPAI